jgi:hypothetical protein
MYIWSLETMWPLYIYREVIITSANSQQEISAIASNQLELGAYTYGLLKVLSSRNWGG